MPRGIYKHIPHNGTFKKGEWNGFGFKKGQKIRLGIKHSQETKDKIGKANSIALKGKKIPDSVKEKIAKALKGEKSYLWKGGISQKKGYRAFIQMRRVVRLKTNGGNFSFMEWLRIKEKFKFTCVCCGKKEPKIKLTIDHIKPISKGGKDDKENIQPLCRNCNNRKYTKIIDYRNEIKPIAYPAEEIGDVKF